MAAVLCKGCAALLSLAFLIGVQRRDAEKNGRLKLKADF